MAATVPVSEREPNAPQATGMEMLTEWPISIVTMHGAVLGMIFCLMLLPIFGRPKKIRRTEDNNFGHHLDAVAALMKRVGGENYARGRISDYMKRMHGETSGPGSFRMLRFQPDRSAHPIADRKPLPSKEASPQLRTGQREGDRTWAQQRVPDRAQADWNHPSKSDKASDQKQDEAESLSSVPPAANSSQPDSRRAARAAFRDVSTRSRALLADL